MSDDIFIKHPAAFQQPYIARASKNAQEPVIAQRDARTPAIYQVPSTYNHRSPSTYQNPVATQNPFIRNQQEPNIRSQQEPNIRAQQIPFTYQHRSPLTYNHRSPFEYSHRSPSIYQVSYQARQPSTYQHRSPGTYRSPVAYRHPIIYQHRSPSSYQATGRNPVIYQHQSPSTYSHRSPSIANAQNPFIRNAQTPFTYVFRSPSIGSYQTTYSHQQPASGFLTVGQVEYIARASELITGFGTGAGIPNDTNTGNSIRQQGASSIVGIDGGFDLDTSASGSTAIAGAGFEFRVQYTNTNDVEILVREVSSVDTLSNTTPHHSRIGNMSSSASSSFSYTTSDIGTSSFAQIFKLTNIGASRAQVKVNYANPTASPYCLNPVLWNGQNSNKGYTPDASNYSTLASDMHVLGTPEQWPRTTTGVTSVTTDDGNVDETTTRKHALGVPTGVTGITTSYQNLGTHGLEIGYSTTVDTNGSEGSATDNRGSSTILEFMIKDLDTNVEHKCDLLIVFAVGASCESNNNDEEEGE